MSTRQTDNIHSGRHNRQTGKHKRQTEILAIIRERREIVRRVQLSRHEGCGTSSIISGNREQVAGERERLWGCASSTGDSLYPLRCPCMYSYGTPRSSLLPNVAAGGWLIYFCYPRNVLRRRPMLRFRVLRLLLSRFLRVVSRVRGTSYR